jgi:hypothetical protein
VNKNVAPKFDLLQQEIKRSKWLDKTTFPFGSSDRRFMLPSSLDTGASCSHKSLEKAKQRGQWVAQQTASIYYMLLQQGKILKMTGENPKVE